MAFRIRSSRSYQILRRFINLNIYSSSFEVWNEFCKEDIALLGRTMKYLSSFLSGLGHSP